MGMQPTHTMMHEKENQQQRLTQLFNEIQEINQTCISENPGNLLIQKASLVANGFFKSLMKKDHVEVIQYEFSQKIDDGLMPILIFLRDCRDLELEIKSYLSFSETLKEYLDNAWHLSSQEMIQPYLQEQESQKQHFKQRFSNTLKQLEKAQRDYKKLCHELNISKENQIDWGMPLVTADHIKAIQAILSYQNTFDATDAKYVSLVRAFDLASFNSLLESDGH